MAYIDSSHSKGKVYIWDRNDEEGLVLHEVQAPYYFYVKNKSKDECRSLYNEPLGIQEFNSYYEMKNKREELHSKNYRTYESDISPIYKILSRLYYNTDIDTPVNIGFYDIEVDFDLSEGKGFPSPDNPYGEINSITLFDVTKQKYYMFMLTNSNIQVDDWKEGLPVVNFIFQRESDLLRKFEEKIETIDVLSGWNSEGFDDLYVYERVKKLFGEDYALKFFCRDGFKSYIKETVDDYGNDVRILKSKGRVLYDLMNLYKNFTQNELESYSLNSVSDQELKEEKIEYEGNLGDLYRNDPQKFFEYSFYDVFLLKKLHDKLQHINLAVKMCRSSCVLFDDIFGSVRLIEMAIYNYCHFEREEEIVLPDLEYGKKEKAPGAFVYTTVNGVHEWIMSIDLSGLYPSIIRALNIGPETHIFQCKNRQDDFIKIVEKREEEVEIINTFNKDTVQVRAKELNEMIRDNGFTISANGSIFTNEYRSIMAEVLDRWKSNRDYYKKQMKQAETEEEKERYNNFQWIMKIIMNSLFGICLNEYSRFYDPDIARSITLSGQFISSFQGRRGDELIESIKE